jgi:hypothetical protein
MVPKLLYTYAAGEIEPEPVLTLADDADWPPLELCVVCGRVASPCIITEHGAMCFACADPDGPDAPTDPGARAAWRDVALTRTHRRLVAARAARELAPVLVPALATIGQ